MNKALEELNMDAGLLKTLGQAAGRYAQRQARALQ
jgi:hypothetical protein